MGLAPTRSGRRGPGFLLEVEKRCENDLLLGQEWKHGHGHIPERGVRRLIRFGCGKCGHDTFNEDAASI